MKEIKQNLDELKSRIDKALQILNLAEDKNLLKKLEEESAVPGFWNERETAQNTMQKISDIRKHVEIWEELEKETKDLIELADITEETEHDITKDIIKRTEELSNKLEKLEFQLLLGGKYDKLGAILSIYSGAGGVDAQDWAEMLLRMYLKFFEKEDFEAKIVHIASGEEAGIKSVTIEVKGPYAFGYLKAERGVHRLVRLSPYDSDHARHTSFALVEVFPEIEEEDYELDEKDLKVDTFRASGHGGQSVNTTDSAVRITHIPTGIVASCQNERSQLQNKNFALKMLKSRLKTLEEEQKSEKMKEIRGETISAEWGSQIRSYVLHPYNMVKDLRTEYETSDTKGVLEGDLIKFIEAYLEKEASK